MDCKISLSFFDIVIFHRSCAHFVGNDSSGRMRMGRSRFWKRPVSIRDRVFYSEAVLEFLENRGDISDL